jgi:Pre-mRNA-splicing factor SF3A3, of SF3a complex, Prp9
VEFTDEEGYGKYLDLHENYVKFINLKGIEVCFQELQFALMLGFTYFIHSHALIGTYINIRKIE